MEHPLIRLQGIERSFKQRQGLWGGHNIIYAVRDFSVDIFRGFTLGVVGESGCGKSTLARMAVGLLMPDSGDVFVEEKPLYTKKAHEDYVAFRRGLAGRVQMIFQDPSSSLNPRMRIGESIAEPLLCVSRTDAFTHQSVQRILTLVGLDPDATERYPHEFSGGQRQRISIARALITRPDFVVCDEPTSSLDASVQSQVLNLLREMQKEFKLTYMFISHDLAVIRHMSDRIAVMYQGFLVEEADAELLFGEPHHPYTRLLLASVPEIEPPNAAMQDMPMGRKSISFHKGTPGAATQKDEHTPILTYGIKARCPFSMRCPQVMQQCHKALPELIPFDSRRVRCFLYSAP